MQISQRNRFEKELLEAKNVAEKALLENDELVRLKQQLEANQQLLERQLQHVKRINSEHYQIDKVLSHDLQEPLRKINLFTSIILETNDVAEPVAEKLVKISKSSDKIRNLIDSMQRFHLLDYKPFVLDAHDLVSIINKAQIRADANCEIIYEGTPFPVVTGDVELLKSLFQELLTNSVKFAKPDVSPVIVITCETVMHNIFREIDSKYKFEEFVRITYTDNGIGFDHMYSLQIFELFKKLHVNDGLGIGMSYCKKIIDLHQGFINVVSQPGVGTTFTILLPK
jgi:sigma-B regulation protein RsbU (phosphoserine phosphatase)